jgi:hypothetical protein
MLMSFDINSLLFIGSDCSKLIFVAMTDTRIEITYRRSETLNNTPKFTSDSMLI